MGKSNWIVNNYHLLVFIKIQLNILIDLLNVLNLFYVSTGFENETIDKEADKEVITNSSDSVTYTVDYNSVINNVRKDEIITSPISTTVMVTDTHYLVLLLGETKKDAYSISKKRRFDK